MAIFLTIVVSYAFDKYDALYSKDAHSANCYTMYSKGGKIVCVFLHFAFFLRSCLNSKFN